ncbi:D-alanyl-D-alanine carboxypeptidase/D-alanyl-D-alanine-endopeptidase [Glaciihabitans arcticus]|uniref:D-alanyl-D-alanine carboxypeptidase/D-alanyl-D-alanine-endopeptidase n=1 Tax=Glaciihabitans arcticus TaxID=2668039 RepID=A0A4Q9GM20_9MICO|nr:D-alanyl-D-alanine carboxypeptidase/D-alanyl-D-alanine-endopeptidase [Glaciihabitans arcticus]TBN55403.1 D-alanyl-D-alanine carboxypeptidase/D-alanyl-D-alanine-endopeptidase [Glaciihabitans arcticus]
MTDPNEPLTRRAARDAAKPRKPFTAGPKPLRQPTLDPATGERLPPKGIAALYAKHPRIWLASTLSVAFLVLCTGALFAGVASGRGGPSVAGPDGSVAVPDRAVPQEIPAPTRLRTCTVAPLASDPALMTLRGEVINASTKEVMFTRGGTVPARTGSVLKPLTASAALLALGPDYRLTTSVFEGTIPGSVVLVGGGDATLNSLSNGENIYKGAAKLSDLATKVTNTWSSLHGDEPITSIVLDATMWDADDSWNSSWARSEQTSGYLSEVTALQFDGDRQDPTQQVSPRSSDPVMAAGKKFAAALGVPNATLSLGKTASSINLGEVRSQPVSTLINQMLVTSDGTLAETLARVVSSQMGLGGGSASVGQAISTALQPLGIDTGKLAIVDGSGLSAENGVPPDFMAQFMALAVGGTNDLTYVYNALSVAGESGALKNRFTGDNAIAKGKVVGKTGYITTAYTLSGLVTAEDGTVLAFAFYAIGEGIRDTAKPALDTLVTGLYSCGDNLANN